MATITLLAIKFKAVKNSDHEMLNEGFLLSNSCHNDTIHITLKTSETKDNIYFSSGEQYLKNPNRHRQAPTPQSGLRRQGCGGCRRWFGHRCRSQRSFGCGDGGWGLLLVLVVAIGVDGLGADHWGEMRSVTGSSTREARASVHGFVGMTYLLRRRSRGSGGACWRPRRRRPWWWWWWGRSPESGRCLGLTILGCGSRLFFLGLLRRTW